MRKMRKHLLKNGGWSDTCAVATANTFQDALSILLLQWKMVK